MYQIYGALWKNKVDAISGETGCDIFCNCVIIKWQKLQKRSIYVHFEYFNIISESAHNFDDPVCSMCHCYPSIV